MPKHAYLSASASHRWLACPPSAKLCAQEEDRGSPYAQQGTDAHELCQYLLEKALGKPARDPTEDLTYYDAEMQEAAEGYCAFVMEQVEEAKKLCKDPLVCVADPGFFQVGGTRFRHRRLCHRLRPAAPHH